MPNYEKVEKFIYVGSVLILITWFIALAIGMYAIVKYLM